MEDRGDGDGMPRTLRLRQMGGIGGDADEVHVDWSKVRTNRELRRVIAEEVHVDAERLRLVHRGKPILDEGTLPLFKDAGALETKTKRLRWDALGCDGMRWDGTLCGISIHPVCDLNF